MEEIDLFCTPDYPMPTSIVDEDYDSERDILIPKDLPSNNTLSFAKKESFHFDIPSFSRLPAKPPDDVEGSAMTNKKTNVASKKNVVRNKKVVSNVDVKNALKTKDVLCVSCGKNVLTPCHDKCHAKYKLNVNSNVRKALFTTPRTAKPKFLDTNPVVTRTRRYLHSIKEDLDNLFGPLYEEYFKKRSPKVSINSTAQPTPNNNDTPSSSSTIVEDQEAPPIVSSYEEQMFPYLTYDDVELVQEDSIEFDSNTLITPYDALTCEEAESSSITEDPSNMHEFHQV
nr:hypothetical protein [Tanacetum cinerariifolium]